VVIFVDLDMTEIETFNCAPYGYSSKLHATSTSKRHKERRNSDNEDKESAELSCK